MRKRYTDQQRYLIGRAKAWKKETGRVPKVNDWRNVSVLEGDWPSYLTCIRAFGTWDDFIRACGWKPRGRGRPWHEARR